MAQRVVPDIKVDKRAKERFFTFFRFVIFLCSFARVFQALVWVPGSEKKEQEERFRHFYHF